MALALKAEWRKRPWWLNLILLFSLFMTFIYSPFDVIFKPLADDEDVWLGIVFTGWGAKAGGLVHWLVYGALSWGLWTMQRWAWWLGSLYSSQVAIAMFTWPLLQRPDYSWVSALIAGLLFTIPAVAFWRAGALFRASGTTSPS